MRVWMIRLGFVFAMASLCITIYDSYFGGRPMAYTREERREMKKNERKAIAGIVTLLVLSVALWFATIRAFALAA